MEPTLANMTTTDARKPYVAPSMRDIAKRQELLLNMEVQKRALATRIPPMAIPYGMKLVDLPLTTLGAIKSQTA